MSKIRTYEGGVEIKGARFGIVAARFNSFIVDSLLAGALDTLKSHGAEEKDITVAHVSGAFEIPLACQQMASSGNYDAIIALGAVIRGGTPHFEYVAGECTKGLMQVMLEHNIPVAFGVLTVDTIEQAVERSVEGEGNKGAEATLAVIDLLNLLPQLSK